jgi:hypothetical protein
MSTKSTILLSNISAEALSADFSYSEKQKGAGYYGSNNGIHTAIYNVEMFKGTIKLQGTLELYPGDNDWVDIDSTENGYGLDSSAWTNVAPVTFTGNFVWIRAAYNVIDGTIIQIRYNY